MNYILLSLCLLSTVAFAQDYIPLIEEGKTWHMTEFYSFETYPGDELPYGSGGYRYTIKGDTLINELMYSKLYSSSTWSIEHFPDGTTIRQNFDSTDEQLIGCLREDIENRKVYYLHLDSEYLPSPCILFPFNEEILLYDFGLNIGDTVGYTIPTRLEQYVLGTKENTALNNGLNTMLHGFNYGRAWWMEGIGDTELGLFGPYSPFILGGGGCSLDCVVNEDTDYLRNGGNCGRLILSSDDVPKNSMGTKIFPIPTDGILNIETLVETTIRYKLYSNVGELIKSRLVLNSRKFTDDLSALANGIYIAEIHFENGSRSHFKVMKH